MPSSTCCESFWNGSGSVACCSTRRHRGVKSGCLRDQVARRFDGTSAAGFTTVVPNESSIWSLSRPAMRMLPGGGLEPFDERAAFEVGKDRVELVGHFFELGQQIALLDDGFSTVS